MRSLMKPLVAAVLAIGVALPSVASANGRHHNTGDLLIAGAIGLTLGAILGSHSNGHVSYRYGNAPRYYAPQRQYHAPRRHYAPQRHYAPRRHFGHNRAYHAPRRQYHAPRHHNRGQYRGHRRW